MPNTMTVVSYKESTDKFTVHLSNEDVEQTISASKLYDLWESYRAQDNLGAFDTALAKIYDDEFIEEPTDLVGKSATF